ncbi:MAG: bacteriorhodopsin-like [Candidatus Caenarcaniphilales bacterium]|nr:bacteriorhodopsin-like [Candidatus Caenarcaniphilales bacterium]
MELTLQPGDVIGFTFFTGYMSMMAASIFFFLERERVDDKWKTSLLVSGLITFIAAVHYFYMRGVWLETQKSPTEFRYIDWILTVPLMCAEFYLLLQAAGAKIGMLWRLIAASLFMLITGYIGEGIYPEQTILWGFISTIGWAYIIYEIFAGEAKKVASESNDKNVKTAFNILRGFVFIGWAIYPIGYMLMPGNFLEFLNPHINMNLIYNIGDAVNKIGFGLVIYVMAIQSTLESRKG